MPPEPAADSYGTPEGVAALAKTWTEEGAWVDPDEVYSIAGTNPTLTTVVSWIDQISAMLNIALDNYGFVVPLTAARAIKAASQVVEGYVSDLARYANNNGRFMTEAFAKENVSVWEQIRLDINDWVQLYAPGLEAGGATRTESNVYKIGTRSHDAAGEEIFPIFQRKGFGNRFDNWTKP